MVMHDGSNFPIRGNRRFQLRAARDGSARFRSGEDFFFCLLRSHLRPALQLGTIIACIVCNQIQVMKITSLLFLAGLAALSARATAVAARMDDDIVVLPPCIVEAPREQPAVARVETSLHELSRQATVRTVLRPQMSLLQVQLVPVDTMARALKDAKSVRLAKS
jgi:hypothetical protein